MGIYDRDYMHDNNRSYNPRHSRRGRYRSDDLSMVTKIIIANVILFFANGFLSGEGAQANWLTNFLALTSNTLFQPWNYWKFITYGFAHDPNTIWHIAGNMLGLFFLGREVERRLGSREFLFFYLFTIVFSGLVWAITNINTVSACMGASGGVVGVVILFTLFYPTRTLMLNFFIPVPAWAVAIFILVMDMSGAVGLRGEQRIAFAAHLAGAAFAALYFYFMVDFTSTFGSWKRKIFTPRPKKPKYNVFDPEPNKPQKQSNPEEEKMAKRVDEILKKYSAFGEASLTQEEREYLKKASGEYKKKFK
ncbi:MAG: rhomboid family intramembrane serine protease [Thermoguttaceae bacterium]